MMDNKRFKIEIGENLSFVIVVIIIGVLLFFDKC
jgi:hypothetical protein